MRRLDEDAVIVALVVVLGIWLGILGEVKSFQLQLGNLNRSSQRG